MEEKMDGFYVSAKIEVDRATKSSYIGYKNADHQNGGFVRVEKRDDAACVPRNQIGEAVAVLVNEMGDTDGLRLWVQPDHKAENEGPQIPGGSGFLVSIRKKEYLSRKNGEMALGDRDEAAVFSRNEIGAAVAVLVNMDDSPDLRIRVHPNDEKQA